jgi:hypothetical protein
MADFEMRHKLPKRIGWIIFRRWGSIPNGVMWTDVMWTSKRADLKRTMDIRTAARSILSIRVQSPLQMPRGGEPPRPRAIRGFAALGSPNPECRFWVVRPEGANHLWRRVPPGELSIDPEADERLARVTEQVGASWTALQVKAKEKPDYRFYLLAPRRPQSPDRLCPVHLCWLCTVGTHRPARTGKSDGSTNWRTPRV